MWLLKNLIWLVIMILVVGFAILNVNETVTAVVLPGRIYRTLPSNVALFSAFVIGMLTAFLLTLAHQLKTRAGVARIRRENQDLKRELDGLRNLPLEDLTLKETAGAGRE
jgi:uncharacterized integral membrane protein